MPSFWQTWPMVSPAAKSTSAARSLGMICSGVCFCIVRLLGLSGAARDSHITWTRFWGADHLVMRTCDLDVSGTVWRYTPGSDAGPHGQHKNAWRGHSRVILIGPRGQEVLRPWLRLNLQEYLFQPHEARLWWCAEQRKNRKTPMPPSQLARKPKKKAKRRPGIRYTTSSYCVAVANACKKAGI